ncbi:cytokine receptor-like factor 1 [Protopterus annectens]|uniref:cytokine receptor-like factor 1 n=1 Tax=Protopterus annectens TaxID=7888 RepID=UPI001CF9CA74|nr:cytokine receptor-like factor 1 [Protopterus annectens]
MSAYTMIITCNAVLLFLSTSLLSSEGEKGVHSVVLQVGSSVNATCNIHPNDIYGADQVFWTLNHEKVHSDTYYAVNRSAVKVYLTFVTEGNYSLCCHGPEGNILEETTIKVGISPQPPTNLSCRGKFGTGMICKWKPASSSSATKYVLKYQTVPLVTVGCKDYVTGGNNACFFKHFHYFFTYTIWVEAHNKFGTAISKKIKVLPAEIAVTDPPCNIHVGGEPSFSDQLNVNWGYPKTTPYLFPLMFELKYRRDDSREWMIENDIGMQTTYDLYDLKPDTVYCVSIRCKWANGKGIWSKWSEDICARTVQG